MALVVCSGAWLLVRCNPSVPELTAHDAAVDAGGNDAPSSDAPRADAPSNDAQRDGANDAPQADSPSGDASSDAGDASSDAQRDASSDAPITDSGGNDAPADALADAGDGAASGYCASLSPAPGFCADFDEGSFDAQFAFKHTTGTGLLSGDSTASVSPPTSFLARVGASSTGNGDFAFMTRVFGGSATQFTYAFDLRLDAVAGGQNSGVLAAIIIDDGAADSHTLSFYTTGTYAAVEEVFARPDGGMAYLDHTLSWVPKLDTWTRVSFSIDTAAGTCAASIDGKADLTSTSCSLDPSWTSGPPAIDLGWSYVASQASAWSAHYDNVVATWK